MKNYPATIRFCRENPNTEPAIVRFTQDFANEISNNGNNRFVLVPRFNKSYLSLRYCGLEIIQIKRDGEIVNCLSMIDGRIRNRPDNGICWEVIRRVHNFLLSTIENPEIWSLPKRERLIPGFSLEHWLESIIMSDTTIGAASRRTLGMNEDIRWIVSQVPVIMPPARGHRRRRHCHIDLMGQGGDTIIVAELKKDNDRDKAIRELLLYTNWLMGDSGQNIFDIVRGTAARMKEEGYIPGCFNLEGLNRGRIRAVAVLNTGDNYSDAPDRLINGVVLQIKKIRNDWLTSEDGLFL